MSVLDFRIRRGGALLHEMAEDGDLVAPDPVEAIAKEVQDDILNDVDQFSDEMQDRMIKIVDVVKNAQDPPPPVLRAINQYDGVECFSRLITKISPIYDKVDDLKDLNLDVSQKSDMLHVLDQIQDVTQSISNTMIPMLSKMNYIRNFMDNEAWTYKDIYSAIGFITMNLQEIITKGLNNFSYSRKSSNILCAISNSGMVICERDDIIRKRHITINDMADECSSRSDIYNYRNIDLDRLIKDLLNTETVLNLIADKPFATSIEDIMRWAKQSMRPTVMRPHDDGELNRFIEKISNHIRWIMTESYAMLCDLSGDVQINKDIFLDMSIKLCVTICNIFNLCTLVLFERATEISSYMASKDSISKQISRIKHEVIKV